MFKKGIPYILLFIIVSFSVHALIASIDKPKMVLYYNVTSEEPLIFEESVIVNNDNDVQVQINLRTGGDFKDIALLRETDFILEPQARKEAFYDVIIAEPGIYSGEIIVKFTGLDDSNVAGALAQIVTVRVEGIGDFENIDSNNDNSNSEADSDENNNGESNTGNTLNVISKPNVGIGLVVFSVVVLLGIGAYYAIIRGIKK